MYSKEEASRLRQQFWIAFGQYMKPIPAAEGLPVNWVNYKTGVKHIFFKMDASQKEASLSIHITHPDETLRMQYFEQFEALKLLFTEALGDEWVWEAQALNEYGVALSSITKTLHQVNIFDQSSWPTIIPFLKTTIVALDEFWTDVKPIFQDLNS
jgi:hypothetical protein